MSLFPETPGTLLKKIAALQRGDDAAVWADFVERYTPAVREFLRMNRGDVGEAELDDLTQEVFVKLVEVLRQERYDPKKAKFRTYLSTLMRNLLVDRWRARREDEPLGARREGFPEKGTAASADMATDATADPRAAVDAVWRVAVRKTAIRHVLTVSMLAEESKAIYRAYALEGGEIGEVAERFGVTRNTVSKIKMRVDRMVAAVEEAYLA